MTANPLVSLIAMAAPVPWLVTRKAEVVAAPSLVKLKVVFMPEAKVKLISLSNVVVMVLPA